MDTDKLKDIQYDSDGNVIAIALIWSAEDIIQCAKDYNDIDLTKEQVSDVLSTILHRHDASMGVSWDVIEVYIDDIPKL